jgi:hydrogenase maturation protease
VSKLLVIGIGNDYRHDDAAGLEVARRLKQQASPSCDVHEQTGEGTALMDLWKDAEGVIVVDAVHSGASPGTVHRFDAHLQTVPAPIFRDSTHSFGLIEAIELSRALKQLPSSLVVYGIEGEDFEAGTGLSAAVSRAVDQFVQEAKREIRMK